MGNMTWPGDKNALNRKLSRHILFSRRHNVMTAKRKKEQKKAESRNAVRVLVSIYSCLYGISQPEVKDKGNSNGLNKIMLSAG